MLQMTEVIKIRRKVLLELARLTWEGSLSQNISEIADTIVTSDGPRYRCCVHKERAVLKDRIKLGLAQPLDVTIAEAAEAALKGTIADMPIVNIMPEACDQCPIDKFLVTNACRNCVAHNCIASCPKNAITVVQNQAYIDKSRCIECGLCKKSCLYGAIVEISRPCERACELGAIKSDKERRAAIDYDKCVQCGGCKAACPFGAINEQSYIVQVIQAIKSKRPVYAMLAPAFISQLGIKVKPFQVFAALKSIGFTDVSEVALGADVVTLAEAEEFLHAVPGQQSYMTTSCCPAFVDMVGKHLPESRANVSTTPSPMVVMGQMIKEQHPDAVVVFVGPCIAKKAEARKNKEYIDYVLTFEELATMLANINLTAFAEEQTQSEGSQTGILFARAGGVSGAVVKVLQEKEQLDKLKAVRAEGLEECYKMLKEIGEGKRDANFMEGMACTGGCVGGPGVLADSRVSGKMVENFAVQNALADTAPENEKAVQRHEVLKHK
ncbi:4Fe-4S dicluster domain-containing protein [Azotosporobacter soli]|uniref:4Fe-4S dicluster domain-containing protein n=1 Tax=Azotosporobacter soli TaxID=3055040 RepID=UPI0031FF4662